MNNTHRNLELTETITRKIRVIAAFRGISMSQFIRDAITNELANSAKDNSFLAFTLDQIEDGK